MALLKHRSPCLLFALILLINKYAEWAEAVSVELESNTELNTQARFNDTGLNETLLKLDAEEQPGDEQTEKVDDTQPRLEVRRVNFDEIDDEYDGVQMGKAGNIGNINSGNFQNINGMYLAQDHYLRIKNQNGLQLIVRSPHKEQNIRAINGVVTINGKTMCTDTRLLPTQPTYQKTPDGAMWYTNLPLGSPMSPKEIEEFKAEEELRQKKKEDRRREKERRKSEKNQRQKEKKAAAKSERKERKRAQKELKRAASTLRKESDRMVKEMKRQGKAMAKEWERNEKDRLRQKERAKDGGVKLYEKFKRGSESESDDEDSDWDD